MTGRELRARLRLRKSVGLAAKRDHGAATPRSPRDKPRYAALQVGYDSEIDQASLASCGQRLRENSSGQNNMLFQTLGQSHIQPRFLTRRSQRRSVASSNPYIPNAARVRRRATLAVLDLLLIVRAGEPRLGRHATYNSTVRTSKDRAPVWAPPAGAEGRRIARVSRDAR